ncbi:MAG: hypothetical protein IPP71_18625 [Bacteroidetes bacterium]|nr:hypothetical protein [Bacteroidota bacterium]
MEGPVKKIGNTGFVFPTGANNSYRPIEISAPATTTSEFIAEFKDDSLSVNTNTKDTTLARLLRKQYWNLNRTSGTSQVYVSLGWNSFSSLADTLISVASWNGSQWKDLGKGILSGNVTSGNLKSNVVATSYSQFIIAFSGSSGVIMPPECYEVANATDLKNCLLHSGVAVVVNSFDLNGLATTDFPLVVPEGVLLSSSFKWWEPECPIITSNHKAVYDANNISSMFVLLCNPIQQFRICGLKEQA